MPRDLWPCAICVRSISASEGHYQPSDKSHHGVPVYVFACHHHDKRKQTDG